MLKRLMVVFVQVIVLLVVFPAVSSGQSYSALVADCAPSSTSRMLENGTIRARVLNSGGQGNALVFEVPKGGGNHAMAADALWLAGMVGGELRVAATTYGPNEFWPGPLPEIDMPLVNCESYDRMWTLDRHLDFQSPSGSANVSEWPADLGAPYHEIDGDEGYSPSRGDRPQLLGDKMHWWIMNDRGNAHGRTKSDPIGVEVRGSAFAFDEGHRLENSLFYRYQVVNRNSVSIEDAYIGRFVDVSFNSGDDYIGTDTTLSLVYTYNSDDEDIDSGQTAGGYGLAPPAFGFSIIEASHSKGTLPSDTEAGPGAYLTNSLNYYRGPGWTILRDTEQWYWHLKSIWSDGTPLTEGGDGHESSLTETRFAFPGDPVAEQFWSENDVDGFGGRSTLPTSRWLLGSYGPFDLAPNETATFTIAYTWARGSSHLDSVTRLKGAVADLWEARGEILSPPIPTASSSQTGPPRTPPPLNLVIEGPFPNPAVHETTLTIHASQGGFGLIKIYDLLGRSVGEYQLGHLPAGLTQWRLDVSDFPPGTFVLRIHCDEASGIGMLIVRR